MASKTALAPIPQPPGSPLVGNALTVDASKMIQGLMELAEEYGPIYQLEIMGTPLVFVSSEELVAEVCDERRFDKTVRGPLKRLRLIAGDGLFTGDSDDPNWAKAHNILLPSFSQKAMGSYLPMMTDIANQLMLKWERMNSDDVIDVPKDMIRLTLDTIGVCGFGYRFNSFYREDFHPFIQALNRTLDTTQKMRGLPGEKLMKRKQIEQLHLDAKYMNNLVDEIIKERQRQRGEGGEDLLDFMLSGRDASTGERLSDENIRFQINTFLIAGHETTSGLLSFSLYYLLKNRDVLAKAYAEVDRVLGRNIDQAPTLQQLGQMPYIRAILFEALRLWPTAPALGLAPYKDEVLGGKYAIPKGTFTTVLIPSLHRDPAIWGDDPDAFNPDHFSPDAEAARSPAAYKPFGNGKRACIGRQFAIQESILVLSMLLQRFDLFDHSDYTLDIKETLSIKPNEFTIKARMRDDVERGGAEAIEGVAAKDDPAQAQVPKHGTPLLVLFGSNLGSSEGFAHEVAQRGEFNGFDVTLAPLDHYVGQLPKDGAVVIACASYNGKAPDNAAKFVDWIDQSSDDLSGVSYLMLGCGNSDWAATFQDVPRHIDARMEALGAKRITATEELDARGDVDTQFHDWLDALIPQLGDAFDVDLSGDGGGITPPLYSVEITQSVTANAVASRVGADDVVMVANRELKQSAAEGGRSTRHIEVQLDEGVTYEPGDHLCVVPVNDDAVVDRLLKRFGLDRSTYVQIESRSDMRGPFPSGSTFSVLHLAKTAGELQAVATRKDIAMLAHYAECPNTKGKLEALAAPASDEGVDLYAEEVLAKRKSVLDILEDHPACELPLAVFLELIPFLSPRYYSISSSPDADAGKCSITVGVVKGDALSGKGEFKGTCSNYLAELQPGDRFKAVVRQPSANFRLPDDPAAPIIMVGPGTGIAPFRGFMQRRAFAKEQGGKLGEAMLFYGCRDETDYLYRDELESFAAQGLVELHTAYSRASKDRAYVQDLITGKAEKVWSLIEAGARIYICGDGAKMEPDVRAALIAICVQQRDMSEQAAADWMDEMIEQERYMLDVWVG